MPRKYSNILWFSGLVCLGLWACSQKIDGYKDFLDGKEIKYPGIVTKTFVRSGDHRLGIGWTPSPDPSIIKYKIFWNNYRDSMEVPATTHSPEDTVFTVINNLDEYTYTFFVYSEDVKGRRSIPVEISNARVFGNAYRNSLMNRAIDRTFPFEMLNDDGSEITLYFLTPDSTNAVTNIRYINLANETKQIGIPKDQNSLTLTDYKYGTKIAYVSEYTPVNALDTFTVNLVDTFPKIEFVIAKLDKSLFKGLSLPNDVGPYEPPTNLSKLWDGTTTPQGWNNLWHSGGDKPLPHHFTFDMGRSYRRLQNVEVTGRDCCHNPTEYEIWGINDLTEASYTTLPGNDPGWKDQAIAKGWKLLQEVTRSDNGVGPYIVNFPPNMPTVRYIRFRIKKVASNESAYSNLSELTFEQKR
jgi:hypothetical protein